MKAFLTIVFLVPLLLLSGCMTSTSYTEPSLSLSTDYYTGDVQSISSRIDGTGSYELTSDSSLEDISYAISAFRYLTGDEGEKFDKDMQPYYVGKLSFPIKVIDPLQEIENYFVLSNASNSSDNVMVHFYTYEGTSYRSVIPTSAGGYVLYTIIGNSGLGILDLDGNRIVGMPVASRSIIPSVNNGYAYPREVNDIVSTNQSAGILNALDAALEYAEKKLDFQKTRILYVDELLSLGGEYVAILDNGEYYHISSGSLSSKEDIPKPVPGPGFTTLAYGRAELPAIIDSRGVGFVAYDTGDATYSGMLKAFSPEVRISDYHLSWDSKLAENGFYATPSGIAVKYSDDMQATIVTDQYIVINGPESNDIPIVCVVPDYDVPKVYVGFSFIDGENVLTPQDSRWLKMEYLDKLQTVTITDSQGYDVVLSASDLVEVSTSSSNNNASGDYTCWFQVDGITLSDLNTVISRKRKISSPI